MTGGSRKAAFRRFGVLSAIAVVLIAGTCIIERHMSEHDQLAADLSANRALWDRQGIHDYSYALDIGCGQCVSAQGHHRVVVAADVIDTVMKDTTLLDSMAASSIPTIGGLFRIIQNGLAIPNCSVTARFSNTLGYPESIWVDYNTQVAGDEYTYRADSVVPR
jgi:hypothetical protein